MKKTVSLPTYMPTTTLLVQRPTDFTRLNAHFHLVRYVFPSWLQMQVTTLEQLPEAEREKAQMRFSVKLHSDLRKSFHHPYATTQLRNVSREQPWAVYVLYPRESSPSPLMLSVDSSQPHAFIAGHDVAWETVPLSILLKLLQMASLYQATPGYFVGQNECYIYAKTIQRRDGTVVDICVRIQIQRHVHNKDDDPLQVFYTTASACSFRRETQPRPGFRTYYMRKLVHEKAYFVQLPSTEVQHFIEQQRPVYVIAPLKGGKTTLPYLSLLHLEESTGTILRHFLQHYMAFLRSYGIACQCRVHAFREWKGIPKESGQLPVPLLQFIGIYDNRLQPHLLPSSQQVSFETCFGVIKTVMLDLYPELQAVPVTDLQLAQREQRAILLLQDYAEEGFQEGGLLAHRADPYQELYKAYPDLVKQSLNLNAASDEEEIAPQHARPPLPSGGGRGSPAGGISTYLNYPLPDSDSPDFRRKVHTCLIQLYLKDMIQQKRSVAERLPFYPRSSLFLRKMRAFQQDFEILLVLEQDTLRFINLRTLRGKEECRRRLAEYGIDWTGMRLRLRQKYQKDQEQSEKQDVAEYHAFATSQLFVKIEDLNERILYDADTIRERQQAMRISRPIDELKLTPHLRRLYPEDSPEANVRARQFQAFDRQLDEIAKEQERLSFSALTRQEFMQTLGPILGEKQDDQGQYGRLKLKSYYRRLNMLPSDKANDLHLYRGIWYDAHDRCYLIGSPQSIHESQEKPTLVRYFDVYQGEEVFEPGVWLDMTSVQFVRFHQYTVYPYPFHLIDLYIKHLGRFRELLELF